MTDNVVKVYHAHPDGYRLVAEVSIPSDLQMDQAGSLEYAYRWTQNIVGSWSLKQGEDANDRVQVIDHQAGDWGYRSTSVNDALVYAGQAYVVASSGFTPHEFPVVKKEWFR